MSQTQEWIRFPGSQIIGLGSRRDSQIHLRCPTLKGPIQKKRPHFWGHSLKEAKGRKCQERRCKGPIRQPNRLNVRSRERRVKVKRGLFSYSGEEHLPSQNDRSQAIIAASVQAHASVQLIETLKFLPCDPGGKPRGQQNAHSCTLPAGHHSTPRERQGRNQAWIASMSCPRPFAACPAGSDTAARVR